MYILEEDFFKLANEQYAELVNSLKAEDAQAWEHGEVESYITVFGTELMRRLLQGHLDLRYAQEEYQKGVLGSDGEPRPHRRQKTQRQLESLFGEVVVRRVGYSTQTPEVSALYPQDGKLNLATDKYSDGIRRRVAEEASKVSFAETSETIAKTTGGEIGKRQCEEVSVKVAQDFEDFYAQRAQKGAESTSDLLVVTTDGKGIVMHSKDLREATAKAAKKAAQSRPTRLSPGKSGNENGWRRLLRCKVSPYLNDYQRTSSVTRVTRPPVLPSATNGSGRTFDKTPRQLLPVRLKKLPDVTLNINENGWCWWMARSVN